MKLYKNLEPTDENIKETYAKNLLGRSEDVDRFAALLKGENCPVSMAVDGEWGSGKTFFVKQVAYKLDEDTADDPEKCLTVYYDAWENDNDCDPILSIVDCIARAAEEKEKISVGAIASDILDIVEAGFSNPFLRMARVCRDKKQKHDAENDFCYNKIEPTNKQIANKLKTLYDSIIQEHGGKLIIFIDELDRCKPNFAVSVLERIKHYISLDGRVHVVFSVNRKQLEHTIKNLYGENFDAENYLKRFFEYTMEIPEADIFQYISRYNTQQTFSLAIPMISTIIPYFGIQVREVNAFMSSLIFAREMAQRERVISGFDLNRIMEEVFPILLAEKFTNNDAYETLIRGEGGDILESFWKEELEYSKAQIEINMNMYLSVFGKPGSSLCPNYTYAKEDILTYLKRPLGV